jgi:outer membrane protein assembly factor BamA
MDLHGDSLAFCHSDTRRAPLTIIVFLVGAGDPAGVRGRPGKGYGFGGGARVMSPIGPIRLEYGINDRFQGRYHFGLG